MEYQQLWSGTCRSRYFKTASIRCRAAKDSFSQWMILYFAKNFQVYIGWGWADDGEGLISVNEEKKLCIDENMLLIYLSIIQENQLIQVIFDTVIATFIAEVRKWIWTSSKLHKPSRFHLRSSNADSRAQIVLELELTAITLYYSTFHFIFDCLFLPLWNFFILSFQY